ncbi:hypothetical protein ACFFX0_26395 [Citricoccus parietis]|uniref:Uncharacterized protein n=1 Tax=Citricoccus parietis TaxID=592307 RepID=A0ABV5G6E9_9MICC
MRGAPRPSIGWCTSGSPRANCDWPERPTSATNVVWTTVSIVGCMQHARTLRRVVSGGSIGWEHVPAAHPDP